MDELEEEFSPDKWTQKELVKHLFREVRDIHSKLDQMGNQELRVVNNRLNELEHFKSSTKVVLGIIATVGTALLTGVIALLIKVFTWI